MPEASEVQSVKSIVSQALAKLNIENYSLDINDTTAKGEGYVGKIWRVKVHHQNGETDLIVKGAVNDEGHRNFIKTELVYRNEVHFYTKIIPAFQKFQAEKQMKQPFEVTKCYATCLEKNEEALVLEDLKTAGFGMCNRRKPLDEAHISLVLKQYGKLHALSLALRDQHPDIFAKITSGLADVFVSVFPNFVEGFKVQILKNAEMLRQRGLSAESALAERIAEEIEETIFLSYEPEDERYTVITHGDCWCNNMMFKYDKKTGIPTDHRFIDFQVTRVHSPAFDLAYFFYTSAPKRIMDKVDTYLGIYYDSLSDFLRQLGSDPEKVFPFEIFMKHWRQFRRFGLTMSLFGFRFILSEEDEVITLSKNDDYNESFQQEMKNQKEQDRRVTDIVKHFVENKYEW